MREHFMRPCLKSSDHKTIVVAELLEALQLIVIPSQAPTETDIAFEARMASIRDLALAAKAKGTSV